MQHYMKKRRLHGKILTLLNDNDQIGDHITMPAMSSHPIAHLKNQIIKLIIPWKTTVVVIGDRSFIFR